MFIYTLCTVNGEAVGESALMRQALTAARNYAAAHHAPCIVECRSTHPARALMHAANAPRRGRSCTD